MGLWTALTREYTYIKNVKRVLGAMSDIDARSPNLLVDDIEKSVDAHPQRPAFILGKTQWTYLEFDAYANKIANWASAQGCTRGDTIAVFVGNRLEYVAIWFGLSKIGVLPALINFNLRGPALAHCVDISKAKTAIVDNALLPGWQSGREHLKTPLPIWSLFGRCDRCEDLDAALAAANDTRPDKQGRSGIEAKDMMMKMFTSGTTGLPKAAIISHSRSQYFFRIFGAAARCTPDDRVIIPLPLYHATGGLCGVGMALGNGGAVIVQEKFSVSSFWQDAQDGGATIMMYVGELCRFLLAAPAGSHDKAHKLRVIVGNGLARDVWENFMTRFNVPKVMEFYGATEGNVSFLNMDGPVGSVGRVPSYMRKKLNVGLIKYDVATDSHPKDKNGFYLEPDTGKAGELIGEIRPSETRFRYDGYEDKKASNAKVLHDVFTKGDNWFRSGDLMHRDKLGNYFFVDRIGDTYRWKSENVSTGEVSTALSSFDGVDQANVYGVAIPGYDGRAGMASISGDTALDLAAFYTHIEKALPKYARPVFLRISPKAETTTTFKFLKTDLVKQGFDPSLIGDALYVADPINKCFEKLDTKMFARIDAGDLKL